MGSARKWQGERRHSRDDLRGWRLCAQPRGTPAWCDFLLKNSPPTLYTCKLRNGRWAHASEDAHLRTGERTARRGPPARTPATAHSSGTASSFRSHRRGEMAAGEVNSLAELLQHCGLDGELSPPPALTLGSLDAQLEEGRPMALAYLKEQGFEKLGQRQKVVNEFSKAKREGRIPPQAMRALAVPSAPAEPTKLAEPVDVSEEAPAAAAAPAPAAPGQLRWLVDISDWEPCHAEWQLLLGALPEEDATKVMRFRFTADQKRALTSRYLQRRACFETTGVPWASVEIARTKGGKPFMNNKPSPPARAGLHANWNFNVSHEGKYVAFAAEPRMVCGVDVAAPEEARAGKKKRPFSETIEMMKGQLSPDEWRVINEATKVRACSVSQGGVSLCPSERRGAGGRLSLCAERA